MFRLTVSFLILSALAWFVLSRRTEAVHQQALSTARVADREVKLADENTLVGVGFLYGEAHVTLVVARQQGQEISPKLLSLACYTFNQAESLRQGLPNFPIDYLRNFAGMDDLISACSSKG